MLTRSLPPSLWRGHTGTMYLVDAVFLLFTTDEGGLDRGGMYRKAALAAGAVVDLVTSGRVEVSERRNPRLTVTSPTPTGHAAVDTVLESLAKRPRSLSSILNMPGGNLAHAAGRSLTEEGVVSERARLLIGPAFPTLDGEPERALRSRIQGILDGIVRPPTLEDAALLAILQGAGVAFGVLAEERGGRTRPELRRVLNEIVEGFPLAVAIRTGMKNYASSAAAAASTSSM